tara:strand:- start:187 stop:567 length:381 start_codon:yes stop_codon:yes gene_type:complete
MKFTINVVGKIPSKKNRMMICGRRLVKPKQIKEFEASLATAAVCNMKAHNIGVTDKPVRLHLDVVFGDKRKRDLQNCFGSICDALNGVVYDDDSQIVVLSASKRYQKGEWWYSIYIETLEEAHNEN